MSKWFTAAAVLTLVSSGRLSLDEQVPSLPRGVTVRHLLNQTSGISDSSVDIGRWRCGRSNQEIARALHLSEGTVKGHLPSPPTRPG